MTDDESGGHDTKAGTSRAKWVAHDLLMEIAPLLCPAALYDDPYVTPISDDLDADELSELSGWLWGDDVSGIDRADRNALHRKNGEVELTEPELYVPVSEIETDGGRDRLYGDHRRHRYDPEHGYITGPVIGNIPKEKFLGFIGELLDIAQERHHVRDKVRNRLFALARDRKRDGQSDMVTVAELIRCVEDPWLLSEMGF